MIPLDREFLVQAVIASGVCLGAWVFLIRPQQVEIGKLERELGDAGPNSAAAGPLNGDIVAKSAQRLRQRIKDIEDGNVACADSSKLYGRIMDLADRRRIKVQSIQPEPTGRREPGAPLNALRSKLTVEGAFEDMAMFLEEVSGLSAFLRPESLQMIPTVVDNKPVVTATFTLDALEFSIPEPLARFTGGANGES